MKPILIFSPAARGFAAAANSDVDLNLLLALASSNPFRKISVEPPARASDEGLVAVMPSDDPPPVLDGDAGALVAAGAAGAAAGCQGHYGHEQENADPNPLDPIG